MSMVALEGLRPWLLQRLSALYLLLFTIYFVIYWGFVEELTYLSWTTWIASEINLSLAGLFYLSLLAHAWVGIRDVLLDYIKPVFLRLLLLFTVAGFLSACGIWMLKILFSVTTS